MAGISGIFNIGKRALFTNQRGLEVTSQNIANVSTPGYSRQEAVFTTTDPENARRGQIGTGVEISEIRRIVNRFVEDQIVAGESNFGRLQTEESHFRRIESVFSDGDGTGINQAFNKFFASINDVANNPEGRSERIVLIEQAEALVQRLITTDSQLQTLRKDINIEAAAVIGEINLLAGQIAELNGKIKKAEFSGQNANDFRDERQLLLKEMAGKIDIHTIEDSFGQTTVFVGSGKALVEGEFFGTLQGLADADNNGFVNVGFSIGGGSATDITASITNGRLQGLINMRDTVVPGFIDTLDRLAAATINEMNQQHRLGFGLDGSTGNDFFSPLSPTSTPLSANTGTGAVVTTVSNPAALTFDSYNLTFAGGNYTLTNSTTGALSTAAYVDPTVVNFEGLNVAISGAPLAGDVFQISAHKGLSGTPSVAVTDPNKIAASATAAGIPGDNDNALLLSAVQDKLITALSGSTLQGFYSSITGEVGSLSQAAQRNLALEETIHFQSGKFREEISGVSLDEEMSNIIRFQRAYEASARLIRVADELTQTVLGMLR